MFLVSHAENIAHYWQIVCTFARKSLLQRRKFFLTRLAIACHAIGKRDYDVEVLSGAANHKVDEIRHRVDAGESGAGPRDQQKNLLPD
jgi:hypothetical protein